MTESKPPPPEDSLTWTIRGGGRVRPPARPHCPVQVTEGSKPRVPADVQGQRSLPAVQCVLELGAGVTQVEAFFGDGVVRVESHQDRVSR